MGLADKLKSYGSSVVTATRYVGTFASGAAVAVGVLGMKYISQDQVGQLFDALNQLGTAVASALTALGTIAGLAATMYGAWKSSRPQQTLSVNRIPGVQVHVDTSYSSPAPLAVQALALDKTDPKASDVVPMSGPREH